MDIAIIIGIILQILIYYLVQNYTSNMKKKDCDCITLEKLEKFEKYNQYNLIFFIIEIIFIIFIFIPNIDNNIFYYILIAINLINIFLRVSQIVYWRKYVFDQNNENCDCLITNRYMVINILIWLNIIFYIIIKIPIIIFMISIYLYNDKKFINIFENAFKNKIKEKYVIKFK